MPAGNFVSSRSRFHLRAQLAPSPVFTSSRLAVNPYMEGAEFRADIMIYDKR